MRNEVINMETCNEKRDLNNRMDNEPRSLGDGQEASSGTNQLN